MLLRLNICRPMSNTALAQGASCRSLRGSRHSITDNKRNKVTGSYYHNTNMDNTSNNTKLKCCPIIKSTLDNSPHNS